MNSNDMNFYNFKKGYLFSKNILFKAELQQIFSQARLSKVCQYLATVTEHLGLDAYE